LFGQRLKHLLAQTRPQQTTSEDSLVEQEARERRAAFTVIKGGTD
jgi:hypothetical protein